MIKYTMVLRDKKNNIKFSYISYSLRYCDRAFANYLMKKYTMYDTITLSRTLSRLQCKFGYRFYIIYEFDNRRDEVLFGLYNYYKTFIEDYCFDFPDII